MSNNEMNVIKKINTLNIMKAMFMSLTVLVGVITIIDIFIPDPILFLDEAALASITGVLTLICGAIDSKIKDLKSGKDFNVNNEEVKQLTDALGNTASVVKSSRNKQGH